NAATATTKKDAKSGTKDGKAATKDGKAGTKDAKSAPRSAGGDGAAEASAKAENAFGIGLYQEFAEKGKNPNVFISPFSLHSVLHLTYDGA
ncbi:serpin family protein, partial [Acinetobacter baumannii]